MPSCSMRPKDSAKPPGVQPGRPAISALVVTTISAPSSKAATARNSRRYGMRVLSMSQTIVATTTSPDSTAMVALWVAADAATNTIRPMRSRLLSASSRSSRR